MHRLRENLIAIIITQGMTESPKSLGGGPWKGKIGMRNRNRKSDLGFFVGKNWRGRGAPVPLALEVEMSGCMS